MPSFTGGRDWILYRRLARPPVPFIHYADPSATELLDAILDDYQRVTGDTIERRFEPRLAQQGS
jgi:hypothetical protein